MKHRIQNLESSIQKRGKDRRGAATDATRIKDGFGQWRIGRKRTQRAQRIEGMMGADAGGNLALVGKGGRNGRFLADIFPPLPARSEEHTSVLQSPCNLVCRLLLEKKKKYIIRTSIEKINKKQKERYK